MMSPYFIEDQACLLVPSLALFGHCCANSRQPCSFTFPVSLFKKFITHTPVVANAACAAVLGPVVAEAEADTGVYCPVA